jgi:hypothetical protein
VNTRNKLIVIFAAALIGVTSARAQQTQANSFLKLAPEHRYWWVNGAVLTTAHLVATKDKPKGECVSKWYLSDRAAKQKLVEETIVKYPRETPTTILLGLITQACGQL